MTRNEKIERIREHVVGMAEHALRYAKASDQVEFLEEWQINILMEIGDTAFDAHSAVSRKYESIVKSTNN